MAKSNSTRSTRKTNSPKGVLARHALSEMSTSLNDYACLLAGIEEMCNSGSNGDVLNVAGTVCRQINNALSTMADKLGAMAEEGGAA